MKSSWTESGAREAIDRWGEACGEQFALRLYGARLIGRDPNLVLHGGGNVSFKCSRKTLLGDEVEAVHIKASGYDLATIEPERIPAVDLSYLRRLRTLDTLDDDEMVNQIRTHLLDASVPTPSIEAPLHAFLPHKFVDHTHADAVLTLTNQPNGEKLIREAMGDSVAIVSYVRPGFELAKAVADAVEAKPQAEGVVLLEHGLVTFGDDARTSYERHIALVDACEKFIRERASGKSLTADFRIEDAPAKLAARVAPVLRGLLARPTGDEDHPFVRSILEWRATDEVLDFVNSREAKALTAAGPLTADHLIRTKPWPLFVENPPWDDESALREVVGRAIDDYRGRYEEYVKVSGGSPDQVDSFPRVVLLPGAGMFCWGPTKKDARIAADIAEHTIAVQTQAHLIGSYESLSPKHLYDMEYRAIQRAKLGVRPDRPLEGQVVVISGGAGAIGSATAEVCAEAGAHVVVTDLDEDRLSAVVDRIEQRHGVAAAAAFVMDVTDEAGVVRGFEEISRVYGGVDVVVPNAGVAHVAPIEQMRIDDFKRVMEVNTVGHLLFMREGIRLLKRQGLGGHVVVISSKNVLGPGKDFGAYSASKAAAHQLGKVAAIELAPAGIRVNMITPDAIFGDAQTPSGLWATVGPERAKSRQMKQEDLPEYYRDRNLLKARIYGHHVGNAVVFFASNATPTTGATLPVDGGVVEAFPR